MQCPRCTGKLDNVIEYVIEEIEFSYIREYYCSRCQSSLTEYFDNYGLFKSEWIDFNV